MGIFTPNISFDDVNEQSKFILIWRLCVLFSLMFFTLGVTFLGEETIQYLIYFSCFIITSSACVYLYKSKKSLPIYVALSIIGAILLFLTLNFIDSTVHFGDFIWMLIISALAFFGAGGKFGFLILSLNIVNTILYSIYSVNENIENITLLSNNGKIVLAIELTVALISAGYIIFQFVVVNNKRYQELIDRNRIIETQNIENTTLVKEIHHRVKNNLQIIISLLRIQEMEMTSDESKIVFKQAIKRIMVMPLIHKKLYQEEGLSKIDLKLYLDDLMSDIKSLAGNENQVAIEISSEISKIGLKTIVPIGLMVNELVSNSIKHGFKSKELGEITISIQNGADDMFILNYRDNGEWLEKTPLKNGIGLELIQSLTEQLEGTLKREISANGTDYTFELRNIDI